MHMRDANSRYNLEGGLGKKGQSVMEKQSRVQDGTWLVGRRDGWSGGPQWGQLMVGGTGFGPEMCSPVKKALMLQVKA